VKEQVRDLLENHRVDVFLAYKDLDGHQIPWAFDRDNLDELEDLEVGPARYPLDKLAARLAGAKPELKIGLIARDCNHRALKVMAAGHQLDLDKVETISLACCPSKLQDHAACSYLEPEPAGAYKKSVGVDNRADPQELEPLRPKERLARWSYEFEKCIKCYGCRNICPVCYCQECSLEHPDLISPGRLPPETPIFHLTRAVHMAGRCVDCGLCEEACPMDIPLRLLYREVNRIVLRLFDFQAGADLSQSPFNFLGDKMTLELKPIEADQEAR